jgi:FkbM family methyltransferase
MPITHCRYGDFSIPDHSDLIFDALRLYGEWAQQELDLLSRLIHPGAVVIDAGAFIGTHTRAFSKMIGDKGRVHAFEPNPASYALLLENTKLAHYPNITTYQTALDERQSTGILRSDLSEGNLGGTSLSGSAMDPDGVEICTRRLDDFEFGKIDFIKADIEGMEYSMLLGAEEKIMRDRPVIFLEANDLQASHLIPGWAKTMGYVVLGVLSDAFSNANFNEIAENMFGDAVECGLLLVHENELAERQAALAGMGCHFIDTVDSLAILLRCKPQYLDDALERKLVAKSLAAEAKALDIDWKEEFIKKLQRTEQAKSEAEEFAHSHLASVVQLQGQLTVTEEAKARAEELAHSHMAEVLKLQAQLTATEEAKARAEELAHSHMAEVSKLQAQLTATEETKARVDEAEAVRSSKAYKLLAALKLTPTE